MACNTITVSCLDQLREDFPKIPIVGTVPVIKTAVERSENKRIGILSTKRTAASGEYQKNLIKQFASDCEVINIGTDKLVPLIEKAEINSNKFRNILKQVLKPFIKVQPNAIALGCTHFTLIKNQIQEILGTNVEILDSGEAIAQQVKRILCAEGVIASKGIPSYRFYITGEKDTFSIIAEKLIESRFIDMVETVNLDHN